MKKKFAALLALLMVLPFSGCAKSDDPKAVTKEKTEVSMAMLRLTSSAPLFIAMDKGYFEQEGITIKAEWFDAAHPIAVATASSKVDVGATGITASLFNMAAGNQKLAIVADKGREERGFPSSALIANTSAYASGVTTIESLRGTRIGITQIGSTFHYMLGRLLEAKGMSLTDVELVPLGKLSAIMAALESKQIDACILNEPNVTKVQSAGFGKMITQVGDVIPYQTSALFFSPEFLKKEAVGVRFLRAYSKACNYYYDAAVAKKSPEQLDEIVKIIAKYTNAPEAEVKLGLPYIDRNGRLLASDIKTQIDWYSSHEMIKGKLSADQVTNTVILENALKN